jgi:glucosylglycerate hydrolase
MSGSPLEDLRAEASRVLHENDRGEIVVAAPRLYPHQWSWDAAFIAIGLARLSVPRALTELRSLLRAQWATGMIPHIVFSGAEGYFPGPDVWRTDRAAARPAGVETSGICQPPVHAIALARVVRLSTATGGPDAELAQDFARDAVPRLASWHRWLATARNPEHTGLVQIHHGWESGMDNSPRWDAAYAAIAVDEQAELHRVDLAHVADPSERPSDREYRRYLHLVAQMREVDYDDERTTQVVDFRMGDVFLTAVLALAAEELAGLAADLGLEDAVADQRAIAEQSRAAVLSTLDPVSGLCRDWDARSRSWCSAPSLASFAVLLCGGDAAAYGRQRETLLGPEWAGHPRLRFALPPTLPPDHPGFQPRTYWRGPVWPVMNWLFWWAADRSGDTALAAQWRREGLAQLGDLSNGEYYHPLTGEWLGSRDQSWTAAAALDWIAAG